MIKSYPPIYINQEWVLFPINQSIELNFQPKNEAWLIPTKGKSSNIDGEPVQRAFVNRQLSDIIRTPTMFTFNCYT